MVVRHGNNRVPPAPHRLLQALDRFNAAHPWDHNAHYHRWILRRLPRRFGSALDVGSGTGDLARLLAARADEVRGVDSDPAITSRARLLTPEATTASFTVSNAPAGLPAGPYDVITCVATLHHLPFTEALAAFRRHLAPGGTLVVVGLYRPRTATDHLLGAAAVPLNAATGWLKNGGRSAAPPPRCPPGPDRPTCPSPTSADRPARCCPAHACAAASSGATPSRGGTPGQDPSNKPNSPTVTVWTPAAPEEPCDPDRRSAPHARHRSGAPQRQDTARRQHRPRPAVAHTGLCARALRAVAELPAGLGRRRPPRAPRPPGRHLAPSEAFVGITLDTEPLKNWVR